MKDTPALEALKQALRRLPGVGPKSAQRMALHLLERDREGGEQIVKSLQHALKVIGHCNQCNNLSEHDTCSICSSPRRDHATLCVVESPADLMSMEETGVYQGIYFVLMGHLSPLDGIGPEELGIDKLEKRLADGEVKEVILATNLTVEGDATAHYISDLVHQYGLRASRIAHGVPLGGELEYVDSGTLARALDGRREV